MTFLESIALGALQGLTEFIPVSSSGHLVLLSKIFNADLESPEVLSTIVFLHFGTLLAVLVYYNKLIRFIITECFHGNRVEQRRVLNLTLASIPAFTFGYAFSKIRSIGDNEIFVITCISLISAGIFFIVSSKLFTTKYKSETVSTRQALIIGLFQSLGIIYGVSRSGITITGASIAGVNRKNSLDFAFLLSIPIISGAFVYEILSNFETVQSDLNIVNVFGGVITSFIFGLLAIKFLINYLKNHSLSIFGVYCIIIGLISLGIYSL